MKIYKSRSCIWFFALLIWVSWHGQVVAKEKPGLQDKVVLMGLVEERDTTHLTRMFKAIEKKLKFDSRVEVLSGSGVIKLLGGPGYVGIKIKNLEQLRGYYQQGYLQSYNFEYTQAIKSFEKVNKGLLRTLDTDARWDLYILTNIHLGKAYQETEDTPAAIRAFQSILRTRPDMKLEKKNYSPKVRKLWRQAKRELFKLPQGKLVLDSDPEGAEVYIDGIEFGKTPREISLPHGSYQLTVIGPKSGHMSRLIKIDQDPLKIGIKMEFEASLVVDMDYPGILVPQGNDSLPEQWWPWLGSRLRVEKMATIQKKAKGKSIRWKVSLMDLERSRVIREGWLESSGLETKQIAEDANDLADFLITGKRDKRLVAATTKPKKKPKAVSRVKPKLKTKTKPQPRESKPISSVSSAPGIKRPWLRAWWPYAIGGAGVFVFGLCANATAGKLEDEADGVASNLDDADGWRNIALGSYIFAGAMVTLGVVLHLTYDMPSSTQSALVPVIGSDRAGLVWVSRF